MRDTAQWATWLANDWKADRDANVGEIPTRIHSAQIAQDGTPQWHPDFVEWLTRETKPQRRNGTQPFRTVKVMRRLRRVAVREYEVLYRILVLNERLEETTRWLNERAQRNRVPPPSHRPNGPHYTEKDTFALVVAGVDFAREYW